MGFHITQHLKIFMVSFINLFINPTLILCLYFEGFKVTKRGLGCSQNNFMLKLPSSAKATTKFELFIFFYYSPIRPSACSSSSSSVSSKRSRNENRKKRQKLLSYSKVKEMNFTLFRKVSFQNLQELSIFFSISFAFLIIQSNLNPQVEPLS